MNRLVLFLAFVGWLSGDARAADVAVPAEIVRFVAIDNVCAWPNLTRLSDGSIAAIIHNRPSHGGMEGDIECWTSSDGALWQKRGHPAPNEPNTIRMNHAAGLTKNGDLLVLCSGWTDLKQPERPKQDRFRDAVLRPWVCRSSDGGRTWSQVKTFPAPEPGWTEFIPFGDLFVGEDGGLHVSCYHGEFTDPAKTYKTKRYRSWHLRSDDDDRTWSAPLRLANTLDWDCGYPSSVSRADGRIVTAYYAKRVENHECYHMGVAIWEAPRK